MDEKRIMGLDFGSKTVGVAVSDPLLITAQGLEIIRRKQENKLRQTLARIEELAEEYGVGTIVLGLPKNMNNTEGDRVVWLKNGIISRRNTVTISQRILFFSNVLMMTHP